VVSSVPAQPTPGRHAALHNAFRSWLRDPLFWIVLLAFALRAARIFYLRLYTFPGGKGTWDFGYEAGSIARSLASGEGYSSPFGGSTGPTAWLAPVYPLLVAAVFKLFGIYSYASAKTILLLNSAFSALTCIPLFHIGRRTLDRAAALVACFIWAAAPQLMKWATEWVWETALSALLIALMFWLLLLLDERGSPRRWLLLGALAGAIALTNPALVTLFAFGLLWLWIRHRRAMLRGAAIASLLAIAIASPWLIRNRVVFGRWAFLRSNFGFELDLLNRPGIIGMPLAPHPGSSGAERAHYAAVGELAYIAEHQRHALTFIRNFPGEFARLSARRFLWFWNGESLAYNDYSYPLQPWQILYSSLFALGGWLLLLHRQPRTALLYAWLIVYPLPYYLTFAQERYRHIIEPQLLLLDAWFVLEIARMLRQHWAPPRN